MDLLEQKKTLMLSFTCLDMDKDGLIDLGMFKHMIERSYSKRVTESNIGKIYMSVAGDLNRKLTIEKFSNIANTMQNNSYLFKKEPMEMWPWEK